MGKGLGAVEKASYNVGRMVNHITDKCRIHAGHDGVYLLTERRRWDPKLLAFDARNTKPELKKLAKAAQFQITDRGGKSYLKLLPGAPKRRLEDVRLRLKVWAIERKLDNAKEELTDHQLSAHGFPRTVFPKKQTPVRISSAIKF